MEVKSLTSCSGGIVICPSQFRMDLAGVRILGLIQVVGTFVIANILE